MVTDGKWNQLNKTQKFLKDTKNTKFNEDLDNGYALSIISHRDEFESGGPSYHDSKYKKAQKKNLVTLVLLEGKYTNHFQVL